VAAVISLKGIDQAIADLDYQNENTLKYGLVHAIRRHYEDESSIVSIQDIDAEELVKVLWHTGDDPEIIKSKRKNLSSIKSSVNADLKRLYKDEKNPEGITIGRSNIFVMSNQAKDKILASFKGGATGDAIEILGQIDEALSAIKEILSSPDALADAVSSDGPTELEELRSTVQWLAKRLDIRGLEAGLLVQVSEDEQGPEVVEDDVEIVEEVLAEEEEEPEQLEEAEEIDEDEIEEVLEEVGLDDALEEAEEDLDEAEVEEDFEEVEAEEGLEEAEADEVPAEDELTEEVEEVGEGDALEDVEVIEDLDEGQYTGGADVEVEHGLQEMGLPVGSFGEEFSEGDDGTRKNELLAEAFDGYLGTMERFHNQYLLISEGEYVVGAKAPKKDEQPERRVRLAPFYMGKFPVTNALFEIFVEKTGYRTSAEKLGYATVYYGRLHKKVDEKTGSVRYTFNAAIRCETVHGACWYQPLGPGSTLYDKRNHPVVQVSFEDAMAFAAWTGKRLPTENEWEAAARTADGRVFPWGNEMKSKSCNIEESSVADTTVVDKYIEFGNDFGIVDAIGNVLEWTMDTCESPSRVKNSSTYHIVKGGSWISGNDIRLFGRFKWNVESPSNILGFRCVAI